MKPYTEDGIIYEDIDENTRRVVGYAKPGQPSGFIPPNARRVAEKDREIARQDASDARADRTEQRQERTEARAERPAPGEGLMWGADGRSVTFIPGGVRDPDSPYYKGSGGKSMRGGDADKLSGQIDQYDLLKTSAMNYDPDFAGNSIGGEMENWAQGLFGTGTSGQRDWWANFRSFDNLYRNELFGASLTEGEKQAYAATSVTPRMDPEQVRTNVNRRAEIIRSSLERRSDRLRAGGYSEDEIQASVGEFAIDLGINLPIAQAAPEFSVEQQNQDILPSVNDGQRANANNAGGSEQRFGNNGFDRYVTDKDSEFHNAVTGLFKNRNNTAQIRQFINESGYGSQYKDADIANAVAYRDGTGSYARQGPQSGAGFQKPETGQRSLTQQNMSAIADSDVGNYGSAALSAATLGFDDELVGAAFGDRAGELMQYSKDYAREQSPWLSLAGDVTGGALLGGPLTAGVRYAGIKGAQAASPFAAKMFQKAAGSLPRAAVSAATLQGALTGAGEMNDNRLLGAGIGGAAGFGGGYLGGKIFGGIDNVANSGPATRGGNMVRNLYGGRQAPEMPVIDQPSRMVNARVGGDMDSIIDRLTQAKEFGAPMMLADQPQLTPLAGSVARTSPDAMRMADEVMEPRALGQYDRLTGAIQRDLGPVSNIPQHSEDLIKNARLASGPLYDEAFSLPGASSVQIDDLAQRGSFQNALGRARNLAIEEGKEPSSLGFDFDAEGNTVIGQTPSFRTLDYTKRGLDDVLEGYRDKTTGRLVLDEQGRAIDGTRRTLVERMDAVNDPYKQARAAYAGPAQEKESFLQGTKYGNLSPDALAFNYNKLSPTKQEQFKLGQRSNMIDEAAKVKFTSDPWKAAYGSPKTQEKLATLYPGGAERFGNQFDIERQMSDASYNIAGNSKTQERAMNDANFAPGIMQTALLDAATSGTPIMTGGKLLGKLAGGELGRFNAKSKADALAPLLFDADPAKNAAVLRELQKNIKVQKKAKGIFGGKARRSGSVAGGASSVGLTFGLTD